MSDNVNVLIEKMNQESMRKRKVPVGGRAGTIGNASVGGGGGVSSQGDDLTGNITFDEHGRPV